MEFELLKDISLESVNKAFLGLVAKINEIEGRGKMEKVEVEEKIREKTSLTEVVSVFAKGVPATKANMLYVDVYSFDGILKAITEKITVQMQQLADNIKSLELITEKLLLRVGQSIRIFEKKSNDLQAQITHSISYSQTFFLQIFTKKRLKSLFTAWHTQCSKQLKAKLLLKKSLKSIAKYPISLCFRHWRSSHYKLRESYLKITQTAVLKAADDLKSEFISIKNKYSLNSLSTLSNEKADLLEIHDLKANATKADLRVLYNDMRSILTSYFSNLKASNTSHLTSLKSSLDSIQAQLHEKADILSVQDLNHATSRLKQEIADASTKQKLLTEQFAQLTNSLEIQKTHFHMNVLEKRMSHLESKVVEDPDELGFVDTLKRICESSGNNSPRKSIRLTDVIDKASAVKNQKPRRFTAVITNKKAS